MGTLQELAGWTRFPSSGSWAVLNKQHGIPEQKLLCVRWWVGKVFIVPCYAFSVWYHTRTPSTCAIIIFYLFIIKTPWGAGQHAAIPPEDFRDEPGQQPVRGLMPMYCLPHPPQKVMGLRGAQGKDKQQCSCALLCPRMASHQPPKTFLLCSWAGLHHARKTFLLSSCCALPAPCTIRVPEGDQPAPRAAGNTSPQLSCTASKRGNYCLHLAFPSHWVFNSVLLKSINK